MLAIVVERTAVAELPRWLASTLNYLSFDYHFRSFNRGIVEPTDDLSKANPPSNAPLLDYLAKGFVENGYRDSDFTDILQKGCTL